MRYAAGSRGTTQCDDACGEGRTAEYSASEMMVVAAARQLADGQVVFVGIGLPFLAAILAKRTDAPHAVLLRESGIADGDPGRLPPEILRRIAVQGRPSAPVPSNTYTNHE